MATKKLKANIFKDYLLELNSVIDRIESTDVRAKTIDITKSIKESVALIRQVKRNKKKVIFIGNGGSASIASHQAVDYWKNGKIKAMAFNDHALLTCISNDFGYKHVFEKPVEFFASKGDLLIAISSSGSSENIVRATKMASRKNCKIITLSGFKKNNPLRKLGNINFYVPSSSYGIVEITHLAICHSILDHIMISRG